MNVAKGTNRMIMEDMMWHYKMFAFITLALTAIYLAIGYIFGAAFPTTLFGPMYGGIIAFAIVGIVNVYPVAIGMGSTRTQFLKSFYLISVWMVVVAITTLNLIYLIMDLLHQYGSLGVTFYTLGTLYVKDFHFFPYLWTDLMVGFFLLGLSLFITVGWLRLGMRNFLILFFGLSVVLTLVLTQIDWSLFVEWVIKANKTVMFIVSGLLGLGLMFSTYPMMKNAPLVMKGRKA